MMVFTAILSLRDIEFASDNIADAAAKLGDRLTMADVENRWNNQPKVDFPAPSP
jgi:hypothetical protein